MFKPDMKAVERAMEMAGNHSGSVALDVVCPEAPDGTCHTPEPQFSTPSVCVRERESVCARERKGVCARERERERERKGGRKGERGRAMEMAGNHSGSVALDVVCPEAPDVTPLPPNLNEKGINFQPFWQ
jgi:hypothetical protein